MYDYREGKKRVEEILKNDLEVIENNRLPKSDDLTFNNSYYSWVGSIFIDIRDSSKLFKHGDNKEISKLIFVIAKICILSSSCKFFFILLKKLTNE